ncbi:MAG: Ig-like domain repeat protein [Acidobacteriaceae bacterium]
MLWKPRTSVVCTLTLLALAAAPQGLVAQTTLNVGPGQTYTTIQSGINAANNGDTVLVAPGTYYENIDFKGKAITVTSSGGAAVTTIDGGDKGGMATVLFVSEEQSNSVLSNFTITGGGDTIYSGASDGGVYVGGNSSYINAAAPTIKNNIITANYCHNIDVEFSTPTILNNEVSGVLQDLQGTQGESYCTFSSGIFLGGTPNYSAAKGPTVAGNTIENNLAGSGIFLYASQNALIMNNIIRDNASPDTGSAFSSTNSFNTTLVQNLIYGNTSNCGGAVAFDVASILIAENTIVDNVTPSLLGHTNCIAIAQIYPAPDEYGESGPGAIIANNIISGSTSYPAVNCYWYGSPSESDQPLFQNNILYNAGGPFFGSYCVDVSGQDNNIAADPQFVSPATGNYHLQSTSSAIDSGQNNVLQTFLAMTGQPLSKDLDGNPRIQDVTGKGCLVDMGAYEYPGTATACSNTETLQSSANPSTLGQTVTFTAQLSSTSGVPTGTVQFADGVTILGTQTISSTGASTFSTGLLAVGSHTITATYQPTGTLSATSASLMQQVTDPNATTTTLTCNPSTLSVNTDSLFSATVTSASGTPTGSITFTDNGTLLSQPTLTNGAATYNFPARQSGTQTIVATYVPAGSLSASSASCVVTVNGITTVATLNVAPTVAAAGTPVTLTANVSADSSSRGYPSGDITFYNGTTVIDSGARLSTGTASFTTTTLPPGIDYLTCTYSGPSTFAPSTCNIVPVTITASSAAITLTSSLNPAPYQTPITFTAQVAAGSGGSIIFNVNGQNITTTPNAAGTSTYTISTLSPGSYLITATWFASSSALGVEASLDQVVTVQAAPPDFSLTGTNTTFQLNHSGTGNLLLASLGTFNGTVALTCDPPYPPGYTCKLQFSNVTLPLGFSTNVTYTLAPTYTASNQPLHRSTQIILASLFPLSFFCLIGLSRKRRTHLSAFLTLTLLAVITTATTACGPDHFIPITTGTVPLTFTGTGTSQGDSTPIIHTVTVNATITP